MTRFVDLIAYVAALTAIGVGVACKDAALSLVVVGAIVMLTVIGARILSRSRRLPKKIAKDATNEPA